MDAPGWRENAGASLLDGLQEQLGLQPKQEMKPMEMLVIDHIEKPAAN